MLLKFIAENNFTVYLNPNNGSFDIQLANNQTNSKVRIFNSNGQLVYETTGKTNKISVKMTAAKGIYLIEVVSGKEVMKKNIVIK